jgi:uncharacterized protein (DUF1501 family)
MRRRAFLRNTTLAVTPILLPGIAGLNNLVSIPKSKQRVVLIHLSGGNDGYNTLVPYTDPDYYQAQPTLAIRPEEVVRLSAEYGLHPALNSLKVHFDKGHMLIVPNVSCTGTDSSHHTSCEIWKKMLKAELEQKLLHYKNNIEIDNDDLEISAEEFTEDLNKILDQITSGSDNQLFRISIDGFDTHHFQQTSHNHLLKTYADGLNKFLNTLEAKHELKNTLIVTWSEFGRQLAENNCRGTDHGYANVMMFFGGNLTTYGIINGAPVSNSSMIDAKTVYSSLLDDWLILNT